jgi:hypothetical protein
LLTVFKELVNLPQKFLTRKTAPHLCIIKQTQDKTKSKKHTYAKNNPVHHHTCLPGSSSKHLNNKLKTKNEIVILITYRHFITQLSAGGFHPGIRAAAKGKACRKESSTIGIINGQPLFTLFRQCLFLM